ncbi:MAG TPA: NTP transferase domain-containing protein [Alloprevotella sp.]|mgnify:FL=1|nr:NTP transferase domain-containing protein [Alloprevotella sp.]
MKFAIIAAGEGSRLVREGVDLPKPLVTVGGEPMIERLARIFHENGAEETVIIVNRLHPETEVHVRKMAEDGRFGLLRIVAKTTPSSMHSFYEISRFLKDEKFCLTTVDTIFREKEFTEYIKAFNASDSDGMMAVTDFVDDEKPLYVSVDAENCINGFHDADCGDAYISGGIYCLRPSALATLHRCMAEGRSRMRNFQRALLEDRLCLKAYPFSKILDVDHAGDIRKAEDFLRYGD